ncbi:MAG: DegT/DnrJ/EryC1/StrS family aminotransferase, partial [Candidatus Bathyarchaeia archaeon]
RLQLPFEPRGYVHSWYLFTVRLKDASVDERDAIVEKLRQKGVGATVYYRTPIHLMPYYKQFGTYHLPVAEAASAQVFSLPVHPGVSLEQVDFIADKVIELLE